MLEVVQTTETGYDGCQEESCVSVHFKDLMLGQNIIALFFGQYAHMGHPSNEHRPMFTPPHRLTPPDLMQPHESPVKNWLVSAGFWIGIGVAGRRR